MLLRLATAALVVVAAPLVPGAGQARAAEVLVNPVLVSLSPAARSAIVSVRNQGPEAVRFELPVICHIYPRDPATSKIVFHPEDIAWAVRCAVEVGVDVVKTPYCGDVQAYAQIVADAPLPVVAAGGPQSDSLRSALQMIADVVASGARGATIGRNVWGFDNITAAVRAFQAVIHDGQTPDEALRLAGLAS